MAVKAPPSKWASWLRLGPILFTVSAVWFWLSIAVIPATPIATVVAVSLSFGGMFIGVYETMLALLKGTVSPRPQKWHPPSQE